MGPRVRRSVKGSGAGDHKLRKGARKRNRYLLNSDGRGRKSHSEKKGVALVFELEMGGRGTEREVREQQRASLPAGTY